MDVSVRETNPVPRVPPVMVMSWTIAPVVAQVWVPVVPRLVGAKVVPTVTVPVSGSRMMSMEIANVARV